MRESQARVKAAWPLYLLSMLVAGLVAAFFSYAFLGESLAALGIPDPGKATTIGLPLIRGVTLTLMALACGSFLFSSFLTTPTVAQKPATSAGDLRQAVLGVDGFLAARTGAAALLGAGILSLLLVLLYFSDVSGQPLSSTLNPAIWELAISQVSAAKAWWACALIAFVVGVAAWFSRRWALQPVLLLGSLLVLVPLGLEGHSAAGGNHDYGVNSYLLHIFAMSLWLGGLLALLAYLNRKGPEVGMAVRRYSHVALWCAVTMVVSGLVNAAIRIRPAELFSSNYGLLVVAKTVGVILLILAGAVHRKATINKLNAGSPQAFRVFAIAEVVLMAALIGLAISMGRTPPPAPVITEITNMDVELGYRLEVAPTITNVWTMWRYDLVFGTLAIVLQGVYLWALLRLRKQGTPWPAARTFWFTAGNLILFVTMCSGIGIYMPALFSMHMIGHMILAMGVPVCWVLGGPLTLLTEAVRPEPTGVVGVKQWLNVFCDNPVLRFITRPGINTIQFVVLFYIIYLQQLYTPLVSEHAGHLGMNIVFLISGSLYFWEIIGVDPLPRRIKAMGRAAWLTGSLPIHMWFGVALMQMQEILGLEFYERLGLPWQVDLLHDQNVGGGVAWAAGQFPLIVVYLYVMVQWLKDDRKEMQAYDQQADLDGDAELNAYNDWLAQINSGQVQPSAVEELTQKELYELKKRTRRPRG